MTDSNDNYLVKLDKASVHFGSRTVLHEVSFTLEPGRNWIVLGGNGAGKTTFLSLLRGDVWPVSPQQFPRAYNAGGRAQISPIGFRNTTGWISADLLNLYHKRQWDIPCLECIASGAFQAARLTRPMSEQLRQRVLEVTQRLGIADLLPRKLLGLSSGQAHKVLLARALVHRPSVLFLDEAFAGLDQASRERFQDLLTRLAEQGTQMVMASHNPGDILGCFDSVLELKNGRVHDTGPADRARLGRFLERPALGLPRSKTNPDWESHGRPLVSIEGATVRRQSAPVLKGIFWTIRSGEHWSVTGPNGSGKSTLLRLVLGELHPYPGGRVTRFGSSEPLPIWELKTRIGFFSPELQSRHTRLQTVLETVVSGLYGHEGLHKPFESSDIHLARNLLSRHGLGHLEDRHVQRLSHGQQRLVFLLRSMINRPSILLLDEPCSGLDTDNRVRVLEAVELLARERTHVVLVSHTPEDRIPSINRRLRLENGRVAEEACNDASERGARTPHSVL